MSYLWSVGEASRRGASASKQQQSQQRDNKPQMKSNLSSCSSVSPVSSNSCISSPKSSNYNNNNNNSSNNYSSRVSTASNYNTNSGACFSYSNSLRTKCTKCALWQNLYKIFEFLTTGRLNELGLDLSMRLGNQRAGSVLIERLENLAGLVTVTKVINNPIDPCDDPNWSWDYKCSKHYKLLKLKLKLINQSEQLIKLATCPVANGLVAQSERSCGLCADLADPNSHLFKYLNVNETLAAKLAAYVNSTRPVLERVFEKFASCRLKNSYEINNQSDFYMFLREPFTSSRLNSSNQDFHQQNVLHAIECCANKIYNLLDLLVYDNLKVSIDRPIKEFNALLNSTSVNGGCSSNVNNAPGSLQSRRDDQQEGFQSNQTKDSRYQTPNGSFCRNKPDENSQNINNV
jgi:hypothetical protein